MVCIWFAPFFEVLLLKRRVNRTLNNVLCLSYVLFMVVVLVVFYASGDVYRYPIALGGVICGAVPYLLEKFTRVRLQPRLVIAYFLFLIGSQCLGSFLDFYSQFPWWDKMLHFLSGILLAYVAFALLDRMTDESTRQHLSAQIVFLFVLSFTAFVGVVWEIYEFSVDQLLHTQAQQGNTDTMLDLIADTLGGLVTAAWVVWRERQPEGSPVKQKQEA